MWEDTFRKTCSSTAPVTPTQKMVTFWSFSNLASLEIELISSVIKFWRVTFSTFPMFVPFLEYSIAEIAGRISYNDEYCFRMNSSFESSSYETTLIWLALGPIAKCTRKSRIKFFTISKFSFPIEPDLSKRMTMSPLDEHFPEKKNQPYFKNVHRKLSTFHFRTLQYKHLKSWDRDNLKIIRCLLPDVPEKSKINMSMFCILNIYFPSNQLNPRRFQTWNILSELVV